MYRLEHLVPELPLNPPREHIAEETSRLPGTLTDEKQAQLDAALQRGWRALNVVFAPTDATASQGLTVGTVRARLQVAG